MAPSSNDWFTDKRKKDLASLRRGRWRTIVLVLLVLAAVAFLSVAASLAKNFGSNAEDLQEIALEVQSLNLDWSDALVTRYEGYQAWLEAHGIGAEINIFNTISHFLFSTILSADSLRENSSSLPFVNTLSISLLSALMRVSFLIIAAWRFWLLIIILGAFAGLLYPRVHTGTDVLGLTGNGRLFFSGMRAELGNLTPSGCPDVHITGLACPQTVSLEQARGPDLGRLLEKFGALNETNLALAGIILKHRDYPAYVTSSEEEALFNGFFEGVGLAENAFLVLEKALTLQALFSHDAGAQFPGINLPERGSAKVDRYHNVTLLEQAFFRVLSVEMKTALAQLKPAVVAAVVLAYEAGKVMSYAPEAGKWLRKSLFCHLNARAILHSIAAYSRDFDHEMRMTVRRALVYCLRSSPFGPVRFPVDLSVQSQALRQWVELLSACPHELQAVADEVELFGIISEMESLWSQTFFGVAMTMQAEAVEDVYATHSNLLFVPLQRILKIVREVNSASALRRLEELVSIVSQQQRLRSMSLDFAGGAEKPQLHSHQRVSSPLDFGEIKRLAEVHAVPLEDVRDWPAVRVVLNAFGWLGRRVGDYSVPESSLIFAVFQAEPESGLGNTLGLIGRPAMVALRASRLEERWGRFWQSHFISVESATMAETREDFDRLMAGLKDSRELEEENGTSVTA